MTITFAHIAAAGAASDTSQVFTELGVGGGLVGLAILAYKKIEAARSELSVQNRDDISDMQAKHEADLKRLQEKHDGEIQRLRADLDRERTFQEEDAIAYRKVLADTRAEGIALLRRESELHEATRAALIEALRNSQPASE